MKREGVEQHIEFATVCGRKKKIYVRACMFGMTSWEMITLATERETADRQGSNGDFFF